MGYLLPQEITMPLAQPENGRFNGTFGQTEPRCDFRVRPTSFLVELEMLQFLKQLRSVRRDVFRAQLRYGLLHDRQRPAAIEDDVRCQLGSRLQAIWLFCQF